MAETNEQQIDRLMRELQNAQPRTPLDEENPARRAEQQRILDELAKARMGREP